MYLYLSKDNSLGNLIVICSYATNIDENGRGFWIRRECFVDIEKTFEKMGFSDLITSDMKKYPTYYNDTFKVGDREYAYNKTIKLTNETEITELLNLTNNIPWKEFDEESWGK